MLELIVPRATLDLLDPWRPAAGIPPVSLVSALDGSRPRLQTQLSAYRDASTLYLIFDASDEEAVVASRFERDAPLYEEDVVEIFLAPERLERYFEFEVSPVGTLFDAAIDSPERERSSMQVDRSWDCAGFWAAIRREPLGEGRLNVKTVAAIPFAGLGVASPASGATWRANFYRIDRSPEGDFFAAWSPTLRQPADFHVPDSFGLLRFE